MLQWCHLILQQVNKKFLIVSFAFPLPVFFFFEVLDVERDWY